jgi:hypothetical protein
MIELKNDKSEEQVGVFQALSLQRAYSWAERYAGKERRPFHLGAVLLKEK